MGEEDRFIVWTDQDGGEWSLAHRQGTALDQEAGFDAGFDLKICWPRRARWKDAVGFHCCRWCCGRLDPGKWKSRTRIQVEVSSMDFINCHRDVLVIGELLLIS